MSDYIITYRGHPVNFVQNVAGKVWSVCHIDDATLFETEDDAYVALVDWRLHGNAQFSVRRKNLREPCGK